MQNIYFGVVEDRNDPLKLGRVKVRVFGIHTADKTKIPTDDLPWATPIQPIISASMNGIGWTPTGPVEGTHVALTFIDGEDCQQPVILGTIAGVPQEPVIKETRSSAKAASNTISSKPSTTDIISDITNSSQKAIDLLIIHCTATKPDQDIGVEEINEWHIARGFSEIGYHYVIRRDGTLETGRSINKKGAHALGYNDKSIGISMVGGVDNNLNPENNFTISQWNTLKTFITNFITTHPDTKIIGHNQVSSKACPSFDVPTYLAANFPEQSITDTFFDTYDSSDLGGKSELEASGESIADTGSTEGFRTDIASGVAKVNENYPSNLTGFVDPNGVYPKAEYYGESDLARRSRNENVTSTNVVETDVDGPFSTSWSEPSDPYNAVYPYNMVWETESGHYEEWDDTPGFERIKRQHKSGTFEEIHPNGTKVTKIVKDNFTIVAEDDNVYIKGNCNVSIDGNVNMLVKGNVQQEVKGSYKMKSTGKATIQSSNSIKLKAPRIDFN